MTRKHFFTTIAAILTAPFVVKSEPEPPNTLPRHRPVEIEDVEKYVQAELDRRLKVTVKGDDIVRVLDRYKSANRWK
jgi:hypothetical protein